MEAPQEGAKLTDDTLVYPMPKRNEEEFSGASEAVEAQEEENNAGMNETDPPLTDYAEDDFVDRAVSFEIHTKSDNVEEASSKPSFYRISSSKRRPTDLNRMTSYQQMLQKSMVCCGEDVSVVKWASKPVIKKLGEEREETYLELFYDLIIVVVFIRLGILLKYAPTIRGYFIVFVLFSIFWSQWCMFSHYVTLLHGEDLKHRLLYVAHSIAVFACAVYLMHHDETTFVLEISGTGISACAALVRFLLAINWGSDARYKDLTRNEWGQMMMHSGVLILSMIIFLVAVYVSEKYPESIVTVVLWLIAVFIEQFVSIYLLVFSEFADFDARYYGERMSTWLMLAFGESVIALLSLSFKFKATLVVTSCASFFFLTTLCVHYFDIVDCDHFLKQFILARHKIMAAAFMLSHVLWSFAILLIGIGLKGIMYVDSSIEKSHWSSEHEADGECDDYFNDDFTVSRRLDVRIVSGADFAKESSSPRRRQLSSWHIEDYTWHLRRYFSMLEYGVFMHFFLGNFWHILYERIEEKDDQRKGPPKWRVWFGRISSTLVSLLAIGVHPLLKCYECDPFYEQDDHLSDEHDGDDDDYETGLDIHQAMLLVAGIGIFAFFLSTMVVQWEPLSAQQHERKHSNAYRDQDPDTPQRDRKITVSPLSRAD